MQWKILCKCSRCWWVWDACCCHNLWMGFFWICLTQLQTFSTLSCGNDRRQTATCRCATTCSSFLQLVIHLCFDVIPEIRKTLPGFCLTSSVYSSQQWHKCSGTTLRSEKRNAFKQLVARGTTDKERSDGYTVTWHINGSTFVYVGLKSLNNFQHLVFCKSTVTFPSSPCITWYCNNGWRMSSSGMWRRVALLRTDDSEEHAASIIRMKKLAN
jgi:hypothetical protein